MSSYGKNIKLGALPANTKLRQKKDDDPFKVYDTPINVTSARTKVTFAARVKKATTVADISECFPEFIGSSFSTPESSKPHTTKLQASMGQHDDPELSFFSAYSRKHKLRRHLAADSKESSACPHSSPKMKVAIGAARLRDPATKKCGSLNRNGSLWNVAVAKGFELLREQRDYAIATGRAQRVMSSKKPKVQVLACSNSIQAEYAKPKDPIQRAGRRLLAKAAVPIQTAAWQYLAQREAVNRMWALREVQSYMRRWRAEASRLAYIILAVTIQAIIRGFLARWRYCVCSESAVRIQKIVRGYLVSAQTYNLVYRIVLIQAQARGWTTRFRVRRHLAKIMAEAQLKAANKVQTWWRARSARMLYQFLLVDTIIAQCTVWRYLARRDVACLRDARAVVSAKKIQAAWRGFQGYTDNVFCLVDIMLVQRTVCSWLAKKEVHKRRLWRDLFIRNKVQVLACSNSI